jgi:hypothetical protein
VLVAIIDTIRGITRDDVSNSDIFPRRLDKTMLTGLTFKPQWKVLVLDEGTKKLLDNVVKEDDILNQNIASTIQINSVET